MTLKQDMLLAANTKQSVVGQVNFNLRLDKTLTNSEFKLTEIID